MNKEIRREEEGEEMKRIDRDEVRRGGGKERRREGGEGGDEEYLQFLMSATGPLSL